MKHGHTQRCAAALLAAIFLSGCSSQGAERTPSEWADRYEAAITAHGGEMVEYNPVIREFNPEDARASLALEALGLKESEVDAFGASVSVINTQAYAIAAVQPAQGKESAVQEALQGYIERQQSSFEFYLPDQYQVAQNAKLETLKDGTVLLVMCAGADTVFSAIREELEQAE